MPQHVIPLTHIYYKIGTFKNYNIQNQYKYLLAEKQGNKKSLL